MIYFLGAITFISVAARLLPHPPNFVPILALALFIGVYSKSKWYYFIPILAMVASDLIIGTYHWQIMVAVYGSIFLTTLIAKKSQVFGVLWGAMIFYLATNFAVWAFTGMYPLTLEGLLLSYTMGLPFFKFTLLGSMFYSAIFFGGYKVFSELRSRQSILDVG